MKRHKIKVKEGKTVIGGDSIRHSIKHLSDGEYAVEITKWKDDRSIRQNNLYWKWVTMIANEAGYEKKEMHEALLDEFSPIITTRDIHGKPQQKPLRSSAMNVEQMSDYMSAVDRFATQFYNMNLPRPEDNDT